METRGIATLRCVETVLSTTVTRSKIWEGMQPLYLATHLISNGLWRDAAVGSPPWIFTILEELEIRSKWKVRGGGRGEEGKT